MDDWVLDARVDQIRSFVSVLGALKLSKRQLVHVSVAERGVTVVAQDPSKSLQAQVNFRAETFASYRVNASAAGTQGHVSGVGSAVGTFGLDLGSLIDVLNAFAPLDGECELSMRWPDRDNSLVLAALTVRDAADPHAGRSARMCTHASIAPEVDGWSTTSAADAELVFRGERNAFAMPTTALREIVDDLEWPCAPMTIAMSSHPSPSLSFSSKGKDTGELRIDVDATPGSSALTEFSCAESGAWTYRYRFMKAAASSLPPALVGPAHAREEGGSPTMTRVAIGEGGVVKIVHLVHMNRAAHANAGGHHHHHHSGGYGDSQRYGGVGGGTRGTGGTAGHGGTRGGGTQGPGSYVVPVTFVAYAEVEIDEDEGYNEPL